MTAREQNKFVNNHFTKGVEIQIRIIQNSISHLSTALEFIDKTQDDYFNNLYYDTQNKLKNEKKELNEYKQTYPELFI